MPGELHFSPNCYLRKEGLKIRSRLYRHHSAVSYTHVKKHLAGDTVPLRRGCDFPRLADVREVAR